MKEDGRSRKGQSRGLDRGLRNRIKIDSRLTPVTIAADNILDRVIIEVAHGPLVKLTETALHPNLLKELKRQAVRFQDGDKVRKNFSKALAMYVAAAQAGDAEAQFNVGTYLENGIGTVRDPKAAVAWHMRSAQQKYPSGQYALGRCFSEGIGVAKSEKKAQRYFLLAAKQGDSDAQYALGLAYRHGRGVSRDFAKGLQWLRLAAEQGHPEGTDIDFDEAENWYTKSAGQGDEDARHNLENLKAVRKEVEASLS